MNWTEKLEFLLRSTNYEDLKKQDLLWVEQQLSREEYQLARQLILMEKEQSEECPETQSEHWPELEASFDRKHAQPQGLYSLSKVLNKKITLWQAAAVIFLLGLVGFWKNEAPLQEDISDSPKIVYLRDTVFIEAAVAETPVPKLSSEVQEQTPKSTVTEPTELLPVIVSIPEPKVSSSELPPPEVMSIASTEPASVKGRSVRDVSALLNMLVEVH